MAGMRLIVSVCVACIMSLVSTPSAAIGASLDSTAPSLLWASYLGGSRDDSPARIATDSHGSILVGGTTISSDFPAANGIDMEYSGGMEDWGLGDAYVAKISPAGHILWATYLGGSGAESMMCLAVDQSDNAIVACYTRSNDWSAPNGIQTTFGGMSDAFLLKISKSGRLIWSTYIGGEGDDMIWSTTFAKNGDIVLAGYTSSVSVLAQNRTPAGGLDTFVARLTPDGQLVWATFLGGGATDLPLSVLVDGSDNLFVAGDTDSADFPLVNAFQTTRGHLFAAKLSSGGDVLWSSYPGGSKKDYLAAAALDSTGNLFVAGRAYSDDFPMPGGLGTTFGENDSGYGDGFVAKVTPAGQMEWGRYVGGYQEDWIGSLAISPLEGLIVAGYAKGDFPGDRPVAGEADAFVAAITESGQISWIRVIGGTDYDYTSALAVDGLGNAYIVGFMQSWPFDTPGGLNLATSSGQNTFVAKVKPDGTVASVNLIGGSGAELPVDTVVDGDGIVSVVGSTASDDLPVHNAFQSTFGGPGKDAWIARIDFHAPLLRCLAPASGRKVAGVPTFRFLMQSGITRRRLAFSGNKGFRAGTAPWGSKTLRISLKKGATSWTPSAGRWRALKKLAPAGGPLYWRLEGKRIKGAGAVSPTQSIQR